MKTSCWSHWAILAPTLWMTTHAGQAGNYQDPLKVGWIDSMNSASYRQDFEIALRKNVDIELISFEPIYYKTGLLSLPPPEYYESLDVLVVSMEADKIENSDEFGSEVTKFLESGKCVIVMMQSFHLPALTGAWQEGKHECFVIPEGQKSFRSFQELSLGEHDKNSPLLEGVESFKAGFYAANLKVADECTLHASYSDGTPLVATHKKGRRVDLNFYPVTTHSGMTFYDGKTDGDRLLRNAVYWCVGEPKAGSDEL